MASEADELVKFLKDGNPQISQFALEHVVGLTGTEEGITTFSNTPLLSSLLWLASRPDPADEELAKVFTAFVNLSGSSLFLPHFKPLMKKICGNTVETIKSSSKEAVSAASQFERNKKWTIAELGCMLLANLSHIPEGIDAILQKGDEMEGFHLCSLLDTFVSYTKPEIVLRKGTEGHPLSHIGSILTNVTQSHTAHNLLLDPKRGIMRHLLGRICHSDEVIRRGLLGALKNCLYGLPPKTIPTYAIGPKEEGGLDLLLHLVMPIIRLDLRLDEKDTKDMREEWVERNKSGGVSINSANGDAILVQFEKDEQVRQMIVECLLLLVRCRPVREVMRSSELYPIIRDLDKEETYQPIKDLVYTLVEFLMRDEEEEKTEEIKEIKEEKEEN